MKTRIHRLMMFLAVIFVAAAVLFPFPGETARANTAAIDMCHSALWSEVAKSRQRARFEINFDTPRLNSVSKGIKDVRGTAEIRERHRSEPIEYQCRVDLRENYVRMVSFRPVGNHYGRRGESILFTNRYAARRYDSLSPPGFPLQGISGIAGGRFGGVVAYGGKGGKRVASRFIGDVNWRDLPRAPFTVSGIAGDPGQGPLVYGGGDGRRVARMSLASENPLWRETAPAPFPVKGIAGFVNTGPIVFGGRDGRRVAFMKSYASGIWHEAEKAPFPVRGISGIVKTGILIYGGNGRQVAYIKDYSENAWYRVAPAPFRIGGIAGWVDTGPIVIELNGRRLASMANYARNSWDMSLIAPAPLDIKSVSGEFNTGIVLFVR